MQLGLSDGVDVCRFLTGEEGRVGGGGGGGLCSASSSSAPRGNGRGCQGGTSGSLGSSRSVGVGLAMVGLLGGGEAKFISPGPGLSDMVTLCGRALLLWLLPDMKFKNLFFSLCSLLLCLLANVSSLKSSSTESILLSVFPSKG